MPIENIVERDNVKSYLLGDLLSAIFPHKNIRDVCPEFNGAGSASSWKFIVYVDDEDDMLLYHLQMIQKESDINFITHDVIISEEEADLAIDFTFNTNFETAGS